MQKNIKQFLDGEVPDDVCDWIVEFHCEFDDENLTPRGAFVEALHELRKNPVAIVSHVRSGLMFDVRFRNGEVEAMEIKRIRREQKNAPDAEGPRRASSLD